MEDLSGKRLRDLAAGKISLQDASEEVAAKLARDLKSGAGEKPPAQGSEPTSFKGKKNIYVCEKCKGHIVTVDVADGVTPFTIACHATVLCDGWMQSSMYRVFDQDMRASHEWYRPTAPEVIAPHLQPHVDQGGLLFRKAK